MVKRFTCLLIIAHIVFVMPGQVLAQIEAPDQSDNPPAGLNPIAQDPQLAPDVDRGFIPCSGTSCSACHLVALANEIITWLIGFLAVIFVIVIVVSGARLVISAGNQNAKSAAKSSLTNALIGIIIVFAAFLLVDTVMRMLVGNNGQVTGFGPWNEIECWAQRSADNVRVVGPDTLETSLEPPDAGVSSGASITVGSVNFTAAGMSSSPARTAAQARAALSAAGVLDGGDVISYMGMRQVTIDGVIQINNECQCDVTITEVTGGSHSTRGQFTHANGYKADIRTRDNPELVSFIQDNFTFTGRWSTGEPVYQRVTSTGLQKCAFHSSHLDCQFIPGN